jgi:hypothetical protein
MATAVSRRRAEAPERSAVLDRGSRVQAALALQARVGNRAATSVLARVTYPHLRAVDVVYGGETGSAAAFVPAVTPKLVALKAVYAAITNKPGTERVTLTPTFNPVAGFTQIPGLAGLGGAYDPLTRTAMATVSDWHRLLNRWRDIFNEEYFSVPLGVSGATFPGRLPHNFNFKPEHTQWVQNQLTTRGVRRDTDAESRLSEVSVQGGRLVRAARNRVDTGNSVTWFKGLGWEIFVLGHDGHLHMASHLVGRRHHSSLLGLHATSATQARDAASAGEMLVRDGKIVQLSTKTGHYQSGQNQLLQIVHFLSKKGADLSGTALLDFQSTLVSADARNWWTTTGQAAYETGKTDYAMSWYQQKYGYAAREAELQNMGWTKVNVGVHWFWQKPDGSNANAQEVRQALKARFPLHFDPKSTYGPGNVPTAVSV